MQPIDTMPAIHLFSSAVGVIFPDFIFFADCLMRLVGRFMAVRAIGLLLGLKALRFIFAIEKKDC